MAEHHVAVPLQEFELNHSSSSSLTTTEEQRHEALKHDHMDVDGELDLIKTEDEAQEEQELLGPYPCNGRCMCCSCCAGLPCCKRKKIDNKPKPRSISWVALYREYKPLRWYWLLLGLLAALGNGATFPAFSIIFGEMFQVFFEDTDTMRELVRWYALGFLGLGVLSFFLLYCQTAISSMAGEEIAVKLRSRLFNAVLAKDVPFYDRHTSGDLTSRLSADVTLVQVGCSEKIGLLIANLGQCLAGVIVAFVYGWKMTLVLLSTTPLLALSFVFFSKLMMGSSSTGQDSYAEANTIAGEAMSGFRTVISFGREDYEGDRFWESLQTTWREGWKRSHLMGVAMGTTNLFMFGTYALGFWYGSELIIDGEMVPGDVLTVFFAVIIGAMGLGQAGGLASDFAKAGAAAGAIYNLMEEEVQINKNIEAGIDPDEQFPGIIEFKNVSFSYPNRPDRVVLNDLSFTVPEGATIALVGASGGGKSTILSLMERFYDTTGGELLIDGVEIKDFNLVELRKFVGCVAQEPTLFGGTIKQNILYGRLGATDEEVIEAAKIANAHQFVSALPEGYDTPVGEKGTQLSGGQKQRVAIARAILKDPKVLLLDEATSALDTESEYLVQDALEKLMKDRTTIVVAHRLSTIRNADIIYVLDEGKIVEQGDHDALMALKQHYYSLVFKQTLNVHEESSSPSAASPATAAAATSSSTVSELPTKNGI
mmetsp:Transcript_13485/g.40687  ORF Transcript_13485/g.40687 Transcript_13485/m.40687 type:complete len:709 (+) Transcript_13485:141-2267(+)